MGGTAAHSAAGVSGLVAHAPEPDALATTLAPAPALPRVAGAHAKAAREVFGREFTLDTFARRLLGHLRTATVAASEWDDVL